MCCRKRQLFSRYLTEETSISLNATMIIQQYICFVVSRYLIHWRMSH